MSTGKNEGVTTDKYVTVFTGGKSIEAKVVADDYQWNAELDPNIFEPSIPADYTLIEQ